MKIYFNGKPKEIPEGSLKDLIVDSRGVAVAVNEEVIPKEKWSMPLKENDRVEVIHAVFGG